MIHLNGKVIQIQVIADDNCDSIYALTDQGRVFLRQTTKGDNWVEIDTSEISVSKDMAKY